MKKNNHIFTISATLNLLHLFVCFATVSVRGLDILDNFYVRIALLVLEVSVWMLAGMYLFIKYDVKGAKKAFKTAVLSVLPAVLLTAAASGIGYFGDTGKSSWLLFAFLGTALTFYNKPAVLLTGLIPIADAYVMFAANYGIIFISTLTGTLIASKINRSLAAKNNKGHELSTNEEMSVTQLIDKIEEEAQVMHEAEETDEELSDIVLEETISEQEEDSTLALISIDDDDDESEIISQEAVEIISLDVDELEEAAQEELRKRYDDIPTDEDVAQEDKEEIPAEETEEVIINTDEENVSEVIEEVTATDTQETAITEEPQEEIIEESFPAEENFEEDTAEEAIPIEEIINDEENEDISDVFAQLYEEEIIEDDSAGFEEVMGMVEEIIAEDSGWTFLTEEESDRLLSLALSSAPSATEDEEIEFENEESEEITEEISFGEIIDILSPSDEAEEIMTEESEEELTEEEPAEEIITPEEPTDELSTEETQKEDNYKTEDDLTEEIAEPAEEIIETIPEDDIPPVEEITEEVTTKTSEEPELNFAALEGIFEDFSDISIEDIMEAENMGDEIYEDLPVIETPFLEDEEDIVTDDNSADEILFADEEDDDISEDEIKNLIRGEVTAEVTEVTNEEDISSAVEEIIKEDEISIIADYVEAVSSKEIDSIISSDFGNIPAKEEKTNKKDKELEKKKARDKEFDNWLNRKTARLDVRAIKKALEEKEE